LRVTENRVLRRTFGPKKEEVAEGYKRLRNEERHNWYASPNVIRMMKSRRIRLAGCVAWMEEMSNVYNILVGKPKEKRPLGGPRRRWKNNNIMNLREIWWVWTG